MFINLFKSKNKNASIPAVKEKNDEFSKKTDPMTGQSQNKFEQIAALVDQARRQELVIMEAMNDQITLKMWKRLLSVFLLMSLRLKKLSRRLMKITYPIKRLGDAV